jgi:integrase/recombinase XerD
MYNEKYLAGFEAYLLAEKRVSHNTFSAYKSDIDQLYAFLKNTKNSTDGATSEDLKNFIRSMKRKGLGAKSLSRKISTLKLFYHYLAERHSLPNAAEALIFPKQETKLPLYLTNTEISALLEATGKDLSARGLRNRVIIYLLYASGMRVSELIHLKIDQIDFTTGFIRLLGKGNKERSIPLPGNILTLIREYLDTVYPALLPRNLSKTTNLLFPSYAKDQVKALSRQNIWIILKRLMKVANIQKDISPHSLRHSLATHLLKNGANLRALQLLLGHEQLTTVQVYTHLENSEVKKIYDLKHPRA